MKHFPLLLAWRFVLNSSQDRSLSAMIRICFASIVIATGALTLIAAIMSGFEQATHKTLQGVHADLTLHAGGHPLAAKDIQAILATDFADTILASAPTTLYQAMLQTHEETALCFIKAIDPAQEQHVSKLARSVAPAVHGEWQMSSGICLGSALAKQLNVIPGDTITLVYQAPEDLDTIKKETITIASLCTTGINDFDEHIALAPFSVTAPLFGEQVTHLALTCTDSANTVALKARLAKTFELEVTSWEDLYPPLVAALALEKYAMWIILLLVTIIASLTIVALLSLYAEHKRRDIAQLQALGMATRSVTLVFTYIAFIITGTAAVLGISCAAIVALLLDTYKLIPLPPVYFIDHVPAQLDLHIIGMVLLLAGMASICAGLAVRSSLRTLHIPDVLKGIA